MLKRRFANPTSYLRQRISNAASESTKSKLQWVKYAAPGIPEQEEPLDKNLFPLRWSGYGAVMPPKSQKSLLVFQPGPFTKRPGFAPVCSPSFSTCTPLTNTCIMPVAYCWGFSNVAWSWILAGSKTTTSAK